MKKLMLALVVALACLLFAVGIQNVGVANANPIREYYVPGIWIGYPSSIGGYVNSTVEFEVYVYMPVDSATIASISYSVDGQPNVTVTNLNVKNIDGYVFSIKDITIFKQYTGHIRLENLSEGSHTLVAYANGMSDSQSFIVNSHYVIAELTVLSPVSQVYWEPIPLTFNINCEISNAHYYIQQDRKLISENTLYGNTTLENLPEGNYELLLFVTTEHGQTSEKIPFTVSNSNPLENLPIIASATILVTFGVVAGLVFIKKRKKTTD
jgi:hypothetical protein